MTPVWVVGPATYNVGYGSSPVRLIRVHHPSHRGVRPVFILVVVVTVPAVVEMENPARFADKLKDVAGTAFV
jgi:hypothetical protein